MKYKKRQITRTKNGWRIKNPDICKVFDFMKKKKVKVLALNKKHNIGGEFEAPDTIIINFSESNSVESIISCMLHEYAHVRQYRLHLFSDYVRVKQTRTKKQAKKKLRWAYRAEVDADRIAQTLMKKMFPKLKYHYGYYGIKSQRTWLKRVYLKRIWKLAYEL